MVAVHGPPRFTNPEHVPCCLQQGPMIIGNYKIYKDDPNNPLATIWGDRQWVNGYSEDNAVNLNDCGIYGPPLDCDKVYEGEQWYTRTDNFDSSRLVPGLKVTLAMDIYAHCTFNPDYKGSTYCYQGCTVNYIVDYNPPH